DDRVALGAGSENPMRPRERIRNLRRELGRSHRYFGSSAGGGAPGGLGTCNGAGCVPIGGPSGHVGGIGGCGAPGCVTLLGITPSMVVGCWPDGDSTGAVWSFQK